MGGDSGDRRRRAFSSLASNPALVRVLAAYLMFILTEYAVWIAMLVYAYSRGGTAIAGLVAGRHRERGPGRTPAGTVALLAVAATRLTNDPAPHHRDNSAAG